MTVIGLKAGLGRVRTLYRKGMKAGTSTGFLSVDRLFTIAPGQMTIVTGWAGSGKSEFIDAMAVNTARKGWRWCYYSPENLPVEFHQQKIYEKLALKPFPAGPTERISEEEIEGLAEKYDENFGFIDPPAEATNLDIRDVIDLMSQRFAAIGVDRGPMGVVIDPWNELSHLRGKDLSETEYVSQVLSVLRNWARNWGIHVFLIAHPAKQRRDDGGNLPVVRPDMISGSIHFWNKADNAISVWRNPEDGSQEVDIHIQKIRFKHIGRVGMATLKYDRITGTYWEPKTGKNSAGQDVVYSMARSK